MTPHFLALRQCDRAPSHTRTMADDKGYPSELLHIKNLLLHEQYSRCISASLDVLKAQTLGDNKHLFSKFFSTFYLACAHE